MLGEPCQEIIYSYIIFKLDSHTQIDTKGSVVAQWLAHLPLVLEVRVLIPAHGEKKLRYPNMLSLVSFADSVPSFASVRYWFVRPHVCRLKNHR